MDFKAFLICLCLCLVWPALSHTQDNKSWLRLQNGIDNENSTFSLHLESEEPDLSSSAPDLKWSLSYCFRGIWLLYTERNYEGEVFHLASYAQNSTCSEFPSGFAGRIQSARFVGYQSNFWQATVTFYDGLNLTGNATRHSGIESSLKINFNFSSLAHSGYLATTVYQDDQALGFTKCFKSNHELFNYWPNIETDHFIARGSVKARRLSWNGWSERMRCYD